MAAMSSCVPETVHHKEDDTVVKQKEKRKQSERSLLSFFFLRLCVCVLFLLHPEQSAAVHKASCYPRDRQLNDSLKPCVSSVRHTVLLKINLSVSFPLSCTIFLLMQQRCSRKQRYFVFSLLTLDLYLLDDLSQKLCHYQALVNENEQLLPLNCFAFISELIILLSLQCPEW